MLPRLDCPLENDATIRMDLIDSHDTVIAMGQDEPVQLSMSMLKVTQSSPELLPQ